MSEPTEKLARVVWLDMSCPCGAKFSFEYTTGNAVMKEMVELATAWALEHRHSELRSGPGEAGKVGALVSRPSLDRLAELETCMPEEDLPADARLSVPVSDLRDLVGLIPIVRELQSAIEKADEELELYHPDRNGGRRG